MIRSSIPNLLTLLNLLSGAISIFMAVHGNFEMAAIFILAGALFDFFDGFAARLLNVSSPIGGQLDSLSDLITFGLAPAFMLVMWLQKMWFPAMELSNPEQWIIFTPFLLAMFSALRLAKFNIDEEQTYDFKGLPTPANALFQVSFVFLLIQNPELTNTWFVLPVIVFFSVMLIAPIPLFGLKKVSGIRGIFILILLIWSVAAVILFKFTAGVFIVPVYMLLSGVKMFVNPKGD